MVPMKLDENSEHINSYRIVEIKPQVFYEVDFGDGTFSNDMLPEDIIVTLLILNSLIHRPTLMIWCLRRAKKMGMETRWSRNQVLRFVFNGVKTLSIRAHS